MDGGISPANEDGETQRTISVGAGTSGGSRRPLSMLCVRKVFGRVSDALRAQASA